MGYKPKLNKLKFDVIIKTADEKIEGQVYLLPNTRLLDMLNKAGEDFIAVSNATVYSAVSNKPLFEAEFMALNKTKIVLIMESYTLPSGS
ncbi:MAG: hypothetical protein ACE5GQ_00410 [Nitrospinales bacterium]